MISLARNRDKATGATTTMNSKKNPRWAIVTTWVRSLVGGRASGCDRACKALVQGWNVSVYLRTEVRARGEVEE